MVTRSAGNGGAPLLGVGAVSTPSAELDSVGARLKALNGGGVTGVSISSDQPHQRCEEAWQWKLAEEGGGAGGAKESARSSEETGGLESRFPEGAAA